MFLVPNVAVTLIDEMDERFVRSQRSLLVDLKMEDFEKSLHRRQFTTTNRVECIVQTASFFLFAACFHAGRV